VNALPYFARGVFTAHKPADRLPWLKPVIVIAPAFALSAPAVFSHFAESPSPQAPGAAALQQQQEMLFFAAWKRGRPGTGKSVMPAESFPKGSLPKNRAVSDPCAAEEQSSGQCLEPLYAQRKREDREPEPLMRGEMLNSTGMGDMPNLQQEAGGKHGYAAPQLRGSPCILRDVTTGKTGLAGHPCRPVRSFFTKANSPGASSLQGPGHSPATVSRLPCPCGMRATRHPGACRTPRILRNA
jgi:hypothetical protein